LIDQLKDRILQINQLKNCFEALGLFFLALIYSLSFSLYIWRKRWTLN